MGNLLRGEVFRSRKRAQTWIMLAIMAGLVLPLYGGLTIAAFVRSDPLGVKEALRLSDIYGSGLVIVSLIGTIIVVVFSSSLLGSEYSWNTMGPLLTRARKRSDLISAKWLTAGIFVVFISLISVVLTMVSAIVATSITGDETPKSASIVVDAFAITARIAMSLLPFAAIALFLALLLRPNAAGIAIGIAILVIAPIILALLGALSDVFKSIQKGGVTWNTDRIFKFGGDNDLVARDAWVSAGVLSFLNCCSDCALLLDFQSPRRNVRIGLSRELKKMGVPIFGTPIFLRFNWRARSDAVVASQVLPEEFSAHRVHMSRLLVV